MMKLIFCPHCGQAFKIVKEDKYLYTDFNDRFYNKAITNCVKCHKEFNLKDNSLITDDWIADLIFKVKG